MLVTKANANVRSNVTPTNAGAAADSAVGEEVVDAFDALAACGMPSFSVSPREGIRRNAEYKPEAMSRITAVIYSIQFNYI